MNCKMKNPKYKISPKGKRKLDYPLKKARSSVKLPLIGKTIYLDVKENKHIKQLQCDLKRLGATIEDFVSRDINYLITSQPRPRNKGQSCHGDESPAASPFNCEPSPSPLNVEDRKVTSVTRGKALAEKARITRKTNTLLDNAEQWGVKIVSLEGAFKWIDKELKKLPKISGNLSKVQNQAKCVSSYKTLKSPYVKIETESYCYRPFHLELEVWPRLNVDTPRGSCPFDGTLIKGESREERGDILAAQVDIPSEELQKNNQEDTGNSGKPPTDKSCKKSEPEVPTGGCILTAGEVKRRKELKRKQDRKRGYCECCHIKYEDLDKHVKEERHILYVKNKINYEKLDSLIYTGPNSQHFLAECMKKSALLSVQRENKSVVSKSSVQSISPRKSPRKTASQHVQVAQPYSKSPRKNHPKDVRTSLSKPSECSAPTQKQGVKSPRKESVGKANENIRQKTYRENNVNSPSAVTQKHGVTSPRKRRDSVGIANENIQQKTNRENIVSSPSVFPTKHGVKSPRKETDSVGKTHENIRPKITKGNTVSSPSMFPQNHGVKSPRKARESVGDVQENKPQKTTTVGGSVNSPTKLSKTRILENLDSNTNITIANVIIEDTGISNNDVLSSPRKMRQRKSIAKSAESPLKDEDFSNKLLRSPVKLSPVTYKIKSSKASLCETYVKTVHDDSNKENIKPGKFSAGNDNQTNDIDDATDIDDANASRNLQTYGTASARRNLQTNDTDQANARVNPRNKLNQLGESEKTINKCKQSDKNGEHVIDVSMPCKDMSPNVNRIDRKKEKASGRTGHTDADKDIAENKPRVNDPVIVKGCLDEIVKLGRARVCKEASSDDFEVCFARYSKNDELPEYHLKNLPNQSDRTFDGMIKNWDVGCNSDLDRSSCKKAKKSTKKTKTHHSMIFDETKAVTETIEKEIEQESDLKVRKKKCSKSDRKVNICNKTSDNATRTEKKNANLNESLRREQTSVYNKPKTDNKKVVADKKKSSSKQNVVNKRKTETDNETVDADKKKISSKQTLVNKKRQSVKEKEEVVDNNQKMESDVYMFEPDGDEQSLLFSKTLAERIKERSDGRRSNVKSYNLNELFSRVSSSERSDQSDKKAVPEKKLVKKMSGSCIASAKVVNKYRHQRQGNTATAGENIPKGYQGDDEYERTPGTFKSKISSKIKLKKRSPKKFWHYVVSKPSKVNTYSDETLKNLPKELRCLKDGLDLDLSDVNGKTRTKRSQDKHGDISVASGSEDGVKVDSGGKRKVKKFWHYEPLTESNGNDSEIQDSFKDLPKELRKLKQSLHGFQSDSDNGKRRSRSEVSKSRILDSDSEFDTKTSRNVKTNDQEESRTNSGESTNLINRNNGSRRKKFWHYVTVPVDSDIDKNQESDKNLPKELRELQGPLGWVNSEDQSRRRSSTKSYDTCGNKSRIHDSDSEYDSKTHESVLTDNNERNQSKLVHEETRVNTDESTNSINKKNTSSKKKFWHYVTVPVDSDTEKDHESDKNLPKELRELKGALGCVNAEDKSRQRSCKNNTPESMCERSSRPENRTRDHRSRPEYQNTNRRKQYAEETSEKDENCGYRITKKGANICYAESDTDDLEEDDMVETNYYSGNNSISKGKGTINSGLLQEKSGINTDQSASSVTSTKRAQQKKFWHYVEVPIDSDTDKDHESDKNLPKELRELKGPLGWVTSEDKSRRRSSAKSTDTNDKNSIASGTETNIASGIETNKDGLSQEEPRINSDQSAGTVNDKKRAPKRKVLWHYIEVPVESDTDKANEIDQNIPKELRELKMPFGPWINNEITSRRHSRTLIQDNDSQDSHSECEKHVTNKETKARTNTNKNGRNSKPIINKLNSVSVNYENVSLRQCMRQKNSTTEKLNNELDQDKDTQQVPKWVKELQEESSLTETLGRRQRKPNQDRYSEKNRVCSYKIRKKDTNISYAESNTDDSDEYREETNTCEYKDENPKPKERKVAGSDSDAEDPIENIESESKEINENASNGLKKDRAADASRPKRKKKFWVYVAEPDEESDDDSTVENMPNELKQLKKWKMKSDRDHGNQRGRKEATESKEASNESEDCRKNKEIDEICERGLPLHKELERKDSEIVTEEKACGSKELLGTDYEIVTNKEACGSNLEMKHSKPKSRKRKVFWDYEIVTEDKEEASKKVDRALPLELRNLQDSWTENVCRVTYVTETISSKAVDTDTGKVKSNGDENTIEQQESVNKSVEADEVRCEERSKSPVFNRHHGNRNEARERKPSPVFKKSPKSNLFNAAKLANKHKYAQNGRSFSDDYCPDSDDELSDTIDEVTDIVKVSEKHREIEQAGSGYSRLSREKRRKEWKRKVDSANKSSEYQQDSKRRKLDKYYDVDDCGDDNELGEKFKSPRRRLLTDDNLSDINNGVCSSPGNKGSLERVVDCPDDRECNLTWKPIVVQHSERAWSMLNESVDNEMEAVAKCDTDTRNTRNSARECKIKNVKTPSKTVYDSKLEAEEELNDNESDSGDVDLDLFVPALSSPGRSNSSWNGAVESYLDHSVKSGHDLSFRGISSSFYTSFHGSPLKSPSKNVRSSPFKACLVNSASKIKSPLKFGSRTPDKTRTIIISSPMTSPTVTKVDDDIEFNFGSPQKNCTEYSNLRAVKGVVREKTKPVKFNLTSTPDDRKSKSLKHSGKHD